MFLSSSKNCVSSFIYLEGKHVECDIEKGLNYLQIAADTNNPITQYDLSLIKYDNRYTKRNLEKAIH